MPTSWKRKALKFALNTPVSRYKQAYNVAKMGYNAYKKVKSSPKSSGRDHGGVTQQHDSRTIYRARKMPYRKKKQWTKFQRKVKAVEISDRAKSTLMINTTTSVTPAFNEQGWHECHLYPYNGTDRGTRDIEIMLEDIQTYRNNVVPGVQGAADVAQERPLFTSSTFNDTRKELLMSSASLDVTYSNTGSSPLEVDIYTIIYPRQSVGTNGSFVAAIDTNSQYVSPINVVSGANITAAAQLSKEQRGVTLFELAYGMSRTGAKILKKEKFFIPVGNCITKNVRDPKNHNLRVTSNDAVYPLKRLTQSLVVCFKSTFVGVEVATLTQKVSRSYKYTYEGGAQAYNRYVTE